VRRFNIVMPRVNRSLRVLDRLVFLFSAVDGVEPQSKQTSRTCGSI
jgi:translation elongation factor EF-G